MQKIAVIGTIGVGKSTLIERISNEIRSRDSEKKTKVFGEPSIIHGNLNDILLNKFYHDTALWAYPLQSGISASHDAVFTEIGDRIENGDETIFLVDAPFSSYIYCRIHRDNGRLTDDELERIDNIIRPGFEFDLLVVLEENADTTIERIKRRSRGSEVNDLGYIHEHVGEFLRHMPGYLEKYMKNTKIVRVQGVPDIESIEYEELIEELVNNIEGV